MTQFSPETMLQRAVVIIRGVEESLEEFRQHVTNAAEQADAGIMRALKSQLSVSRKKQEVLSDLELASKDVDAVINTSPEAVIRAPEGVFSGLHLRGLIALHRGNIEFLSGQLASAVRHYQDSLKEVNTLPDTHFFLGIAQENMGCPVEALQAYEDAVSLDPASESGVSALKCAESLRRRMFFGGWFVGSWKLVIGLVLFAVIGTALGVSDPNAPEGMAAMGVAAGVAVVLYWRAKFKRSRPRPVVPTGAH